MSTRTCTPFPHPTLFRADRAQIGPGGGIAPVEQRREQRLRGTAVALRGNGTRMHPRSVSSISRRCLRRFGDRAFGIALHQPRSEEHTSELQSLLRISYAVCCLTKNKM